MSEAKKKLEIFHYATFEEMEEAKRQRARERTLEERFELALQLMDLGKTLNGARPGDSPPGLIILPKRQHVRI